MSKNFNNINNLMEFIDRNYKKEKAMHIGLFESEQGTQVYIACGNEYNVENEFYCEAFEMKYMEQIYETDNKQYDQVTERLIAEIKEIIPHIPNYANLEYITCGYDDGDLEVVLKTAE